MTTQPGSRAAVARRRVRGPAVTITLVLAILVMFLVPVPSASADDSRLPSFDVKLLSLINGARVANGAQPVAVGDGLSSMALWWSGEQLRSDDLHHTTDGFAIARDYGATAATAWGENVGRFPLGTTAKRLFDAYMASPEHRANILNPKYRFIGVVSVADATHGYNTMEFTDAMATPAAKPKPEPNPKPSMKPEPKPKPSVKPEPKPAPSPPTREEPATSPADGTGKEPQPDKSGSEKQKLVFGVVGAAFGKLPLSGGTVVIRHGQCHKHGSVAGTVTTGATGIAKLPLVPGTYCAALAGLPESVVTPDPTEFDVTPRGFMATWQNLRVEPGEFDAISRGIFTMRPV